MKRILSLTVLLLIYSLTLKSQEKIEEFKVEISLPAIEKPLDAKKKYKVVFSENIQYLLSDESSYLGGKYATFNFNFNIGPKQAASNEEADYIIEIVAGETKGRNDKCDRVASLDAVKFATTSIKEGKFVKVEGYKIDYCVSSPLLANIKEDGQIIKSIVLSDEDRLFKVTHHAGVMAEVFSKENNFEVNGYTPFNSPKEIEKDAEDEKLMKRFQKNIIGQQIQELKFALELCYNKKGWNEKVEIPYMLISKKKDENYESFFNQAKLMEEAIGKKFDETSLNSISSKLEPVISFYKANSENDTKIISLFNLIYCYAFTGDINKAAESYTFHYAYINENRTYFEKQPLSRKQIDFLDKLGAYCSLKGKSTKLKYQIISEAKQEREDMHTQFLREQK